MSLLWGGIGGLALIVGAIYAYRRLISSTVPFQPWQILVFGLVGVSLGITAGWFAPSLAAMASIVVITIVLGTISLIDFRTRRIPNALNLVLLAWALVQITWLRQPTITSAGLGLLIGGGIFMLLAIIGRGAMGLGDVKLAAVLGALVGFPLVINVLVIGVFAGGAAAVFLILSHRSKVKGTMAYGPYLALGGWITAMGMLLKLWH
jgi:prepilin signal peptidase PulO-like enzyme (type II secretory pathway)